MAGKLTVIGAGLVLALILWGLSGRDTELPEAGGVAVESKSEVEQHLTEAPPGSLPAGDSLEQEQQLDRVPVPAVDGRITVDGGTLVPDRALRDLFDHFLADASRHGVAASRDLLESELRRRKLSAAVKKEILAVFERYLAYLRELENRLLASQPMDSEQRFQLTYDTRRQVLGLVLSDAFFAEEEAMALAYLAGEFTESRSTGRSRQLLEVRERVASLRSEQGEQADPAAVAELYREAFEEDAAARVRELEERRATWNARVEAFLAERENLLTAGLAERDRERELEKLVEAHFDDREALRLPAELEMRQ
ncbi:MAG: hypothetical protein LAT50_06295 [Ectothiorhodospiraceae bacterium]|nr:hypothetical protein [Ectothiorhodospiraceae bacterium]